MELLQQLFCNKCEFEFGVWRQQLLIPICLAQKREQSA